MSANQVYREDGTPCSAHEYEDRSIHFCLDRENQTYLYAVFDGHDGAKAAYFASQVSALLTIFLLTVIAICLLLYFLFIKFTLASFLILFFYFFTF